MHLQPSPTWYLYNADGAEPLRLLDDDGRADAVLSGTPQGVVAKLAEAIHSKAQHLGERELRHLELFVALRRCRRGVRGVQPCPGWPPSHPKGLALTRWSAVQRSSWAVHADEVACAADGRGRLAPFPGKSGGMGMAPGQRAAPFCADRRNRPQTGCRTDRENRAHQGPVQGPVRIHRARGFRDCRPATAPGTRFAASSAVECRYADSLRQTCRIRPPGKQAWQVCPSSTHGCNSALKPPPHSPCTPPPPHRTAAPAAARPAAGPGPGGAAGRGWRRRGGRRRPGRPGPR